MQLKKRVKEHHHNNLKIPSQAEMLKTEKP